MAVVIAGCKKQETPKPKAPTITTADITNNLGISASGGGSVSSDGGSAVTARGICWSTSENPTTADNKTNDSLGTGSFKSQLANLTTNTIYYVRAYATNAAGTAYGKSVSFLTNTIDLDGNLYHTVKIGTQVWMVENLKVTHYQNGDALPNVTDDNEWVTLTEGAFCNYANDPNNGAVYGRIYNMAATTDQRNICPAGWRLPTNTDWNLLQVLLGNGTDVGGMLKEAGTTHWNAPNTGATNSSGFTALPAGNRGYGGFADLGNYTYFWSDPTEQYTRALLYNQSDIAGTSNYSPILGLSIRCIRVQ
ncbi:MAG: fibrobacter succinogenes major paralogous domain-containing protein [Bacteroidetes bacterium]|nr:fibrobacter succinogenes major paralogous domain-containing protein [Bacteroidota bacterium]